MKPHVFATSFSYWVTTVMFKLTSPNKTSLVSNKAKNKKIKKQWPWIFPLACLYSLEYSEFRKSTFFLISQMWMALVHFLCFSHTENKATGCLANWDIPWLPSLSAIWVITILFKQTNIPILPKSSSRIKHVFSSTQTLFSSEQDKPYLSFRKFAEMICHSKPGVWSLSLFGRNLTTYLFSFLDLSCYST